MAAKTTRDRVPFGPAQAGNFPIFFLKEYIS